MAIYFDDIEMGDQQYCGTFTLTKEDIIEFGRQFDPQPFHVDEGMARLSPYEGLIASGWHTVCACVKVVVTSKVGPEAGNLGSQGADQIRWLTPVRPGDTISVRTEVVEKSLLRTKPDRGLVRLRVTARNQRGEDVMTMIGLGLYRRRGVAPQE